MNPFRRPLVAGNWKMHAGGAGACPLAEAVAAEVRELGKVDVVIAPPYTALAAVAQELAEAGSLVAVAAQNLSPEPAGAFTGEISASMIQECGATWVILGHSERRHLFGESDEVVTRKVAAALRAGLRPIACVGETLAERDAGVTLDVVKRQVLSLLDLLGRDPGFGAIAYEPVWAIGTGRTAGPEQAQEVHAYIRSLLLAASEEVAEQTRLLYGGSVKPDNADALLGADDVDGVLVGGASLEAAGFGAIARAAQRLAARGDGS